MSTQLIEALRAYRQADEDGIMVIVSRQACDEAADEIETLQDILADSRRLTREIDLALNGGHGAAQQVSLCDIVSQVKDGRWRLVRE